MYRLFFISDIKTFSSDTQSWHAFCLLFSVGQNKLVIEFNLSSNYLFEFYLVTNLESVILMLQVQLLRIDSRLLHGQVATNWARILKINRIIVASDRVAQDEIRKTLIKQASPPGLKTHIVPIQKVIRINQDSRFDGEKVLLLVETPEDALRLVLGGIEISRINIGSLSFDNSKKMISDTVAVSQRDIQVFQLLHQHEIQLEIRKVSSDSPKDLWQILIEKHLIAEQSFAD